MVIIFKEDNSTVSFDKIAEDEKDFELFEIFKNRVKSIGIDSILIISTSRDDSHWVVPSTKDNKFAEYYESQKKYYKRIPLLAVYIGTSNNFNALNINEHISRPYDEALSKSVKTIWKEVLLESSSDIEKYYDIDMEVLFRNFTKDYLTSKIYELRNEIKSELGKLKIIQPEEVYSSSIPALNVIYGSMEDYINAKNKNEFEQISELITNLFLNRLHTKYKTALSEFDFIRYLHPEMDGFSWYGYARQD